MLEPIEVRIDLLGGEHLTHYIVPFERIHLVPKTSGLYVWNIRPKTIEDCPQLVKFFQQIKLKAEVHGHLRLRYRGELSKVFDPPTFPDNVDLVAQLLGCAPVSLYIGISSNLNRRLATHKKTFLERIGSRDQTVPDPEVAETPSEDSEEESRFFGERLAQLWPIELNPATLYVRYIVPEICLDRRCDLRSCSPTCRKNTKQSLQACEHFANSLFNPMFGRR